MKIQSFRPQQAALPSTRSSFEAENPDPTGDAVVDFAQKALDEGRGKALPRWFEPAGWRDAPHWTMQSPGDEMGRQAYLVNGNVFIRDTIVGEPVITKWWDCGAMPSTQPAQPGF